MSDLYDGVYYWYKQQSKVKDGCFSCLGNSLMCERRRLILRKATEVNFVGCWPKLAGRGSSNPASIRGGYDRKMNGSTTCASCFKMAVQCPVHTQKNSINSKQDTTTPPSKKIDQVQRKRSHPGKFRYIRIKG